MEEKTLETKITDGLRTVVNNAIATEDYTTIDLVNASMIITYHAIAEIKMCIQKKKINDAYNMIDSLLGRLTVHQVILNEKITDILDNMQCTEDAKHFEDYMNEPK